jgi:hypothetical protein
MSYEFLITPKRMTLDFLILLLLLSMSKEWEDLHCSPVCIFNQKRDFHLPGINSESAVAQTAFSSNNKSICKADIPLCDRVIGT